MPVYLLREPHSQESAYLWTIKVHSMVRAIDLAIRKRLIVWQHHLHRVPYNCAGSCQSRHYIAQSSNLVSTILSAMVQDISAALTP